MSETPEENQAGRGIEGIAHLFLSGLSNDSAPAKRQSPPPSSPTVTETPPPPATASVKLPQKSSRTVFLSDHLDTTEMAVQSLAQTMVLEHGPLLLLDLIDPQAILTSHFKANDDSHKELGLLDESIDSAWQELFGESPNQSPHHELTHDQFTTHLAQLSKQVNSLLIHLPHQMSSQEEVLIQSCDQIVLLCGTSQDQLLKTYQLLKRLSSTMDSLPISIFFYDQQDEEKCIDVFEKLAKAANEFLDFQIEWAGCELTTEFAIQPDIESTQRSDAVMEQINQFLHPTIQKSRDIEKNTPYTAAKTWSPLLLNDLPHSDASLAKALSQSPETWLKSLESPEPLPLPLPDNIAEIASVFIDATGRLHLMIASLGRPEALLGAALEARQWVSTNIQLIQGYCQERNIDSKLAVGLILIGATPSDQNNEWPHQLGWPCQTLQAYLLDNENIKGVLLV